MPLDIFHHDAHSYMISRLILHIKFILKPNMSGFWANFYLMMLTYMQMLD